MASLPHTKENGSVFTWVGDTGVPACGMAETSRNHRQGRLCHPFILNFRHYQRKHPMTRFVFTTICVLVVGLTAASAEPTVVVAEGEFFTPQAAKAGADWKLTPQEQSYASHTYGGMWAMNGALIGAPAQSVDAVATQKIAVPVAGAYRVWSKYQAPPYFNYMHKIEIVQGGKTVFSQVYGKVDAPRFWSFSTGMQKQIWWPWGMDHDAAEAPTTMAN